MKKVFTLSILIFSFSFSKAQWVTIPDPNFASWLQTHYPSCMSGNQMDTTCSGIVNATYMNCSNSSIDSLNGIQYFDNLDTLNCSENFFFYLPVLPSNLTYLDCSYNMIISISNLPNSITHLDCYGNGSNSISSFPTSLIYLDCNDNQLTSLPPLPINLTYLNCGDNYLNSIPSLPNSLTHFECYGDGLTVLPSLPNSLRYFICQMNQIVQLPSLPDTLNYFECSENPLQCMPILSVFTGCANCFDIWSTGITCLPNIIQHTGYIPMIDTLPICGLFNPNGCATGWNINGSIQSDYDSNCNTTNDGSPINNLKVTLHDSIGNVVQQIISNWNGNFSFDTELGNFYTSVDTTNIPFSILCPASDSIESNLTAIDSMDANVDFRFICKPGFDIGAWNVFRWHTFFPYTPTKIYVKAGDLMQHIFNSTCSSGINGNVKIVINGHANYLSALVGSLTPTVTADTLIYTVADFSLINPDSAFAFNILTDSTAQLGDQICFDVNVTPTAGDNNISNNTLTHCFTVSNSFDPNEKEVSPVGDIIFPFNDWLTYTIHFQNTGTAAAQHIQVLDTLDSDLDESTFQLLSSSHDPMIQLFGNQVRFNFVNINLPDSTTNSEGSRGYVSYRIKPKPNLPIGTSINNSASIYFDFNSPIITNTTHTNFIDGINPVEENNLLFSIYPNPSSKNITIEYHINNSASLSIYNLLGQKQQEIILEKNTTKRNISVANLSSGLYFCVIKDDIGKMYQKKLVIEK